MAKAQLTDILNRLKAGYIAILNDLSSMEDWGRVQLEALYATKIGKYEVEILELKIAIKSIKKKIQWAHQEINIGKYPNFASIEIRAKELVAEAYHEVHNAKTKIAFGKTVLSNLGSAEDTAELRKIFRRIAKTLHPDINPNLSTEQKDLWHRFHAAYKNGDLDQVKALEIVHEEQLKETERSPEDLPEEEIKRQTALLQKGILELDQKKAALENEFPFNLAAKIRDEDWVAEKQALLHQEISDLQLYLKAKQADYQLIKETYGRE